MSKQFDDFSRTFPADPSGSHVTAQLQCVRSMRSREDQRHMGAANLNRCGSEAATAGVLHMQLVQGDEDIDAV